eukprot:jgi/Bigna1/142026/aug1.66_g16734
MTAEPTVSISNAIAMKKGANTPLIRLPDVIDLRTIRGVQSAGGVRCGGDDERLQAGIVAETLRERGGNDAIRRIEHRVDEQGQPEVYAVRVWFRGAALRLSRSLGCRGGGAECLRIPGPSIRASGATRARTAIVLFVQPREQEGDAVREVWHQQQREEQVRAGEEVGQQVLHGRGDRCGDVHGDLCDAGGEDDRDQEDDQGEGLQPQPEPAQRAGGGGGGHPSRTAAASRPGTIVLQEEVAFATCCFALLCARVVVVTVHQASDGDYFATIAAAAARLH